MGKRQSVFHRTKLAPPKWWGRCSHMCCVHLGSVREEGKLDRKELTISIIGSEGRAYPAEFHEASKPYTLDTARPQSTQDPSSHFWAITSLKSFPKVGRIDTPIYMRNATSSLLLPKLQLETVSFCCSLKNPYPHCGSCRQTDWLTDRLTDWQTEWNILMMAEMWNAADAEPKLPRAVFSWLDNHLLSSSLFVSTGKTFELQTINSHQL